MAGPLLTLVILVAAVGCGLAAGAFLAFSSFVMRALARLPAPQGIAAMQSINIVVINPVFLGVLFGTGALCIGLAVAALAEWPAPGSAWLLAGSVIYLVGTILVTLACNVPRNNALAALDPAAADAAGAWTGYVAGWTGWNHVRAAAAGVAAALLAWALRIA
jgi:uncharacterized membrane protein